MSPDDELTNSILHGLRSRGVNTAGLIVVVREQYVLISGQVNSYYGQQLVQEFARNLTVGREIKIDVVADSVGMTSQQRKQPESETHHLRNRLNKFVLGMRLLQRILKDGGIPQAIQIVDKLLETEAQSGNLPHEASNRSIAEKTIVVIEDDLNQCLLLSGLLRQLGASVTDRRCAESARSVIQGGLRPDVMLVDLHLTGQGGTEFAHWFRGFDTEGVTRLIAVSTTQTEPEPSPFDLWMPKPLNIERLIKAIIM